MRSLLPALLLLTPAFAGEEKPINPAELPQPVLQRAEVILLGFKPVTANTEAEADGTLVYELQGEAQVIIGRTYNRESERYDNQREVRPIEIDLLADGTFLEYEVALDESEVPYAVRKALREKYPNCSFKSFEASYTADHQVTQYEVVLTHEGQEHDLEVNALGSKIVESDA